MKCFSCKDGVIIEPDSYEGSVNYGRCDSCSATFPHPRDRCSECGDFWYKCACAETPLYDENEISLEDLEDA